MKFTPALLFVILATPGVAQEWVIQDVFLPIPELPGAQAEWAVANPLGDFNFDGKADFLLAGGYGWPSGHQPSILSVASVVPGLGEVQWPLMTSELVFGEFSFSGGWWKPHFAILPNPNGSITAIKRVSTNQIVLRDSWTGVQVAVCQNPTPIPGQSPITVWHGIFAAGDLNQDGFVDLFLEGTAHPSTKVLGAIDGFTGALLWEYNDPEEDSEAPSLRAELSWPGDLNGDQVPDFVATFRRFDQTLVLPGSVQIALSGVNGSVLWRNEIHGEPMRGGNVGGRDVDGDGIEDFLWNSSQTVQMTSGATGQSIWAIGPNYLDSIFSPSEWQYYSDNPSFFTGVSGLPGEFELVQYIEAANFMTSERTSGFAHLDALTGAFLRWEEFPQAMEPWFSDPADFGSLYRYFLLGDIDRDGYTEILHTAPISAFDDPNIFGQPQPGLIYSQSTLHVTNSHPVGQPLILEADFPSSPGKPFRVLLSDQFGLVNGLMIGEWRTNLVSSPLLNFSMASGTLRGTLDASGRGGAALPIPPNPNLSGRTLYSRVVVFESLGSREVWSVSTLGVTELQ